jgi:drug/metabolite transporter (DMT)-like permease
VLDGFLAIARMPVLYAALGLYAAATLVWIWVLSRVPLSQAYPWVAISVGAVPLLAWLVFHERLTSGYWIGLGFIVVGVFLTQYPPPNP